MLEDSETIALGGSGRLVGVPVVQREVWPAMVCSVEVVAGRRAMRTSRASVSRVVSLVQAVYLASMPCQLHPRIHIEATHPVDSTQRA